jgi:hypothetical protein
MYEALGNFYAALQDLQKILCPLVKKKYRGQFFPSTRVHPLTPDGILHFIFEDIVFSQNYK